MRELLSRFVAPYRVRLALGVSAKVVEVFFDLATPVIVARMIDQGVAAHDSSVVLRYALLLMGLAIVGYCFTLVCQKMAALVAQGVGTDLRDALYQKAMSLSAADVDRISTPSLVTRLTNDVNQIQVAIALGIRQLIRWPVLAVGSMVAALCIDVGLGLVFFVCIPVVGLVFWLVMSRSVPYFRVMQQRLDRVSLVCREALSGARVIRAFRRDDAERKRFREAAFAQADTAISVGRLSAVLNPSTLLIMNLGVVAILWASGQRVFEGELTQGQVIAFVNYMGQALLSVVFVANLVVVFTRGAASAQRVGEVLSCPASLVPGSEELDADATDAAVPALELADVSFWYEDAREPAISGVSLSLGQGETLGIIGGTGSGKSTLANLVVRLYDAGAGTVRVFGHDVRTLSFGSLRRAVAIVPQQASLLSGTIRSNLSWRYPDADESALMEALERAQAADFVLAKERALDAPVEAGGKNFSGGQRQRLTIARALVGSPRLLILDDSASALDLATDARLREALGSLSGLSRIVISQRVSSVMGADEILVLDHGHVAGLGTHRELYSSCDLYREICLSQLSEGEVA